jgi:hypothetical protein
VEWRRATKKQHAGCSLAVACGGKLSDLPEKSRDDDDRRAPKMRGPLHRRKPGPDHADRVTFFTRGLPPSHDDLDEK